MSTNDNIRRRALMGTRNGEAHECIVEYTVPMTDPPEYSGWFGVTSITNVNWPDGITTIAPYSFRGSSIDSTCFNNLPSTVTLISKYAFYGARMQGSLILSPNIKYLGEYALGSTGITSITLPQAPCIIGGYALNSGSLTTINISENVPYAFHNNALQNTKWLSNQSNGNVYLGKNYIQYKGTMPSNTDLTLEAGTLSIAANAFQSKTQLKSITIPDTVQFIGEYAFSGCTGLTSITIPKSLNKSLYENPSASLRTLPNGVVSDTIFSTSYSPFYSSACTGITTVNWNAIDGYGGSNTSSMYCFLGGGSYLPNVTTVNFGSEVESIPNYLCYGLKKLTTITIPSSVKYIGNYAFSNCTGLTSITIPETVEELSTSGSILNGCTGLTTLNYNAISCRRCSSLGATPTRTNTNIWGTTSNLTTVNIGNQVQTIPGGFLGSGQSKVTSITIPSSVTTIAYGAFYQSKLTSIDLPSSVTSIGNYAFNGCSSLTSITIRATTPPTLDSSYSNTFPITSQSYTIYVPASAVNTYKTTSGWSNWASKIQAIPS